MMASSAASTVISGSTSSLTAASPISAAAAASAVGSSSSSIPSNSPCAACKFLRRKCQPDCVFAPYFPPDNPQKFAQVHKVFGASNVTKLLNDLSPYQREDAVNSLAYEAEMRLRDPVYGCVGVIASLQHQLRQLHVDLAYAKSELSKYQQLPAPGGGGGSGGSIIAANAGGGSNGPLVNLNHHPLGLQIGQQQQNQHFFNGGSSGGSIVTAVQPRVESTSSNYLVMRNLLDHSDMSASRFSAASTCDSAGFITAMNSPTGTGNFAPLAVQFPVLKTEERQAIGPA